MRGDKCRTLATPQRSQLGREIHRAARSIGILLSNPKVFLHTFRYIHDTGGRFCNTFWDLQL